MNIAVYLASTPGNHSKYAECANEVGERIGEAGHTLVYGGADDGCMGIVADAVLAYGGKAIGVIPGFFSRRALQGLTKLITVETMGERKKKMIELADAFIALPGGPGTIEEISEIISARRIGLFQKPCIILNLDGFYDDLKRQYERMVEEGFLTDEELNRIQFVATPKDALNACGVQ